MSANSAIVFRILGIPSDATIANLGDVLAEQFSAEGIALNTRKTTICPSCYSDGTQTALVQFMPNPPVALLALTNGGGYDIEFGDSGKAIYVDRDFYGLTPLYGAAGPIEADIVAVCGLNGHAYGSWRGRNNLRPMWLRHYLSQDFPNCRTMTYGYNSRLTASAIHTTRDFTRSFLEELNKARSSDAEKTRPIIFIGHSFGGIIIAQALVKAKENDRVHGTVFKSVCGTIFFGTPHRGIIVDDILAMVGEGSPRTELVKSIALGSDALKAELAKFIHCSEPMRIVSFYETTQTRKLAKGSDGRWSRSGENFTFVDQSSSVLYPRGNELNLPAEGDHSSMVKFGYKEHSSYTSVTRFLRDLSFGAAATPNTANTALTPYQAVITGDVDALARMLRTSVLPVDVNEICVLGTTTLLHVAVQNRDKKMIALLLKSGADMEITNANGLTVLHVAVKTVDEAVVELLLQKGAQIEAKGLGGATALHFALFVGVKMVSLLLKNRADITAVTKYGLTALMIAVFVNSGEMAAVLIDNGADFAAECLPGITLLHLAAQFGDEKLLKALLEKGVNLMPINDGVLFPIHFAAAAGKAAVAAILLENGVDIDKEGTAALWLAAKAGHHKVVELLLLKGANVKGMVSLGAPLHAAAISGHEKVVEVLLSHGADIDARERNGSTALHGATSRGHDKVVGVLLRNGANIQSTIALDLRPLKRQTGLDIGAFVLGDMAPIHVAALLGHRKVLEVLLMYHPNIEAKAEGGRTALIIAARNGDVETVGMLLRGGATVAADNMRTRSALHPATIHGHAEVVAILLEHGADRKSYGMVTALRSAKKAGHERVVALLTL